MAFQKVDTSTSGENAIVAAKAGQGIRVFAYKLIAAGSVTVQWMDGTTEMEGPCSLIVGVPVVCPPAPLLAAGRAAYFETSAGNALQLNLGGAVQVSGSVEYQYTAH